VEHIKSVEKRLKKTKPQLVIEDKDVGLLPESPPNPAEEQL